MEKGFLKESILGEKSKKFALRAIKLYKYLTEEKKEYVLSKQILRSGTSVGANIVEGNYSQSNREFIAKYNISLKEAAETEYWLELLHESKLITTIQYKDISKDCVELIKLLTAAIKTTKKRKV